MSDDLVSCYEEIIALLPRRQNREVLTLVEKALKLGASPSGIVERAFIEGLRRIGGEFPRILFAADIMEKAGRGLLRDPRRDGKNGAWGTGRGGEGVKAVICTVRGDLHSIGKNLVRMMLEWSGIPALDLGVDCEPGVIINALRDSGAPLLCLSSLLPTTLPVMAETLEALKTSGLRGQVKVVVGGALVTRDFAQRIGADGYAPDALAGAALCKQWL
jgi:5-methyltetrahydrofolate--homocysteine methyltransferase